MRRVVRPWLGLAAIPLLAAAVLVMHGIDVVATGGVAANAVHGHDRGTSTGDDCDDCTGADHVLAACAAVLATAAVWRGARRPQRHAPLVRLAAVVAARISRAVGAPARPPEPAWVRLAVMRC